MRDYLDIVRRNLLSPIVIAIFCLAGALIYVREYRDAWFISVVIVINSLIGIIQEIRAKRVLKKLELMSQPRARVVADDGTVSEVPYDKLVVDDRIRLMAGDEVPADAVILEVKGLEVNESMLTGESASVEKSIDDSLWAATTILAGEATARVVAVGDDTKAGAISQTLKRYQPELTPLQREIQRAISLLTFGAFALATLILIRYYAIGEDAVQILKTITSAAVNVVPEGLLLASSLLLAFGSLKLARAKVLPQKLSAIEAMALLNILCVDKTGTLTSDTVELERVEAFGSSDLDEVSGLAALIAQETSGGNVTGEAILSAVKAPQALVREVLAFSSARKMAGLRVDIDGKSRTVIMGAPEFVARLAPIDASIQREIDQWTNEGLRVLLLAELPGRNTKLKDLPEASGQAIGAVLLSNALRDGVVDTVDFLQNQGVQIRVISGDNPKTVQFIARAAGIHNPDRVITGSALSVLSGVAFDKAVDEHTIFARVLPDQKEKLIAHFKKKQLFTGMVGDGVNDALALKKADLGVAMYAGAPASRRVADIILLNNSFTSLPVGLKFGNRIMQAIEVIAVLFFHKIIYAALLLAITLALGMVYPYQPRHITFMNMFLVTMPTIMWTLFPPKPRHRVNPRLFWRQTLWAVLPIALITGLAVSFTYWVGSSLFINQPNEVATMTVLTATFYGVYLVFLVGKMLDIQLTSKAKKARLLYLSAVLVVAVGSFGIGPLRDFFDFTAPELTVLRPVIGVIILAAVLQWWLARRAGKKLNSAVIGAGIK